MKKIKGLLQSLFVATKIIHIYQYDGKTQAILDSDKNIKWETDKDIHDLVDTISRSLSDKENHTFFVHLEHKGVLNYKI